jgi:catechol 2,3-dioxygenase-like lactoylglutathione lyase family enzyme
MDRLMRFAALALVLLVALALTSARAADAAWQTDGLDHIMLWTDNIDRTTSVFAVKLGFQVRPGGDFGDGVANRLLRLGDESYIELLYTTLPRAELNEETRQDLDAVRAGTGARTFAVHPLDLDKLDAYLHGRGFEIDPSSPLTYDPDGAGPLPAVPSSWRTVSFAKSPVTTGYLFFIGYAEEHLSPLQIADRAATREHPNGARAWTSIWLLSSDVAADRKAFARIGFTDRGEVDLPQVGAHGVKLQAGPDTIIVLAPKGEGIAAKALASRGTHVLGLSIGVKDVDRAQRLVQRGYGVKLEQYVGAEGDSILAPTYEDLGLLIEFHALPAR